MKNRRFVLPGALLCLLVFFAASRYGAYGMSDIFAGSGRIMALLALLTCIVLGMLTFGVLSTYSQFFRKNQKTVNIINYTAIIIFSSSTYFLLNHGISVLFAAAAVYCLGAGVGQAMLFLFKTASLEYLGRSVSWPVALGVLCGFPMGAYGGAAAAYISGIVALAAACVLSVHLAETVKSEGSEQIRAGVSGGTVSALRTPIAGFLAAAAYLNGMNLGVLNISAEADRLYIIGICFMFALFAAGWIADRYGSQALLVVCALLLIPGSLNIELLARPGFAEVGAGIMLCGFGAFVSYAAVMQILYAHWAKEPALIAGLGMLAPWLTVLTACAVSVFSGMDDKLGVYLQIGCGVCAMLLLGVKAAKVFYRRDTAHAEPRKALDLDVEAEKYELTERERQILEHVIKGESPKNIGEILFISVATVKFHLSNIYRKTGVNNRMDLLLMLRGEMEVREKPDGKYPSHHAPGREPPGK